MAIKKLKIIEFAKNDITFEYPYGKYELEAVKKWLDQGRIDSYSIITKYIDKNGNINEHESRPQ